MRLVASLTVVVAGWSAAWAVPLDRARDPVVMTGSDLGPLLGTPVGQMVAFRFQLGWEQIPVQIDERKTVDFGLVYNQGPVGIFTLAYADPTTYTGPDTDPAFDADDELVFMAKDAGDLAPSGATPPGQIVAGSGLEVEITDPLDGGVGYVYLFRSDGTLSPGAGQDYVTYSFNLLAGDYIPNYSTMAGPNPEDSQVDTLYYGTHFSDRWIRDQVNVFVAGSTGVDVLDRHKNMFAPGDCGRTEDTFSNGEGAFFANIDGPVRAVRSYMGANSGPLTQRQHLFYEQRHDATTFLRVHAILGVMDLYDYSPQASGMFYYNDLNTTGVQVDGLVDAIFAGPIQWEMVSGAQGTLVLSHSLVTDIVPFAFTSYYSDDVTPSVTQCTGDAFEYATSGTWVNQAIPNTDPSLGLYNTLTSGRIVYYEAPGETVATAALRHAQARTPLAPAVQAYLPVPGDYNGDGGVDLNDFANWAACMTGPDGGLVDPQCAAYDFDLDRDVDLVDYGGFQKALTGP